MTLQKQSTGVEDGIIIPEDMQRRLNMKEKRILVVEDEIIIAENIQKKLINMGYSVTGIVSSGKEAIKEVEENNPDLVLMDIVIHGDMDGIETAHHIRSRFDIPVVYLTAYADDKIMERAKITEPFGYILKPFKDRELQITLEIALYKHRIEKELKESERRLRESEKWLSAAIESIGDAVIATDSEGIIKLINPIAEALTGWKQEEALGKHLPAIFNVTCEKNDENIEDPVRKVIHGGSFYGLADNTVLVTKERMEVPVDIIGSPITDEENNIIGVVLVFYDIIERQRTGARLKIYEEFYESRPS